MPCARKALYGEAALELTDDSWTTVAWRPCCEERYFWQLTAEAVLALRAARSAGRAITAEQRDFLCDRVVLLARLVK